MRFHLRTLLIVLTVGPVFIAAGWCTVRDAGYRSALLELATTPVIVIGLVCSIAIVSVGASIAGAALSKR
jgi:hypothetical protein